MIPIPETVSAGTYKNSVKSFQANTRINKIRTGKQKIKSPRKNSA
jgi:hypothetical protein